jgi:hypothetical protein
VCVCVCVGVSELAVIDHVVCRTHCKSGTAERDYTYTRKITMRKGQALQSNRKLDIARCDNVLDLKVGELGREAKLLDDACVFSSGKSREFFVFGSGTHHLARCKDECCCLWLTNSHNHSSKALYNSREQQVAKQASRQAIG